MEKLDELVSQRRSPAPRPAPTRPGSWLANHCDLLALLLLVLASIPAPWLSPRTLVVVRDTDLIDDNWHLDEVFKLSRGIWVGRDVAFTHGPIFQWLSSVPGRSMGLSMGAIYATWDTVPAWCAFVFVYLVLRLLLPEQPAWKRALLLLLVIIFWEPSLRNAFPVLLFAIFLRGWYAVTEGHAKPYAFGIVAGLLCVIAFLIASDTGVYSTAAWVVATAAVLFEARQDKRIVGKYLPTLLTFVFWVFVLALAVNTVMGSALDFRLWKDSAQMVSVYRWATPKAMTDAGTTRLLGTLFAGAAVFLFRAGARSTLNPAITERTGFLLGGFVVAVAMLQSALVRSDYEHLVIAAFAMALLAGTILFSLESRLSWLAILLAIACSMLFSHPAFPPSTIIRLVQQLRHPLTECPAGFREFDRGCFDPEFTEMLQAASGYLSQHSGPQEHIVVFPYQTLFGIASRRSVAGGLMQAYTASGPYLSRLEIAGLESVPAPAGLYLPDGDLSDAVDDVPNFTRSPQVWLWIFRHYRGEQELVPSVFGLQRDDSRAAKIALHAWPLSVAVQRYPIRKRTLSLDLVAPVLPSEDTDFLRLRITVHYSLWWKLRKPTRLVLEIERADSSDDQKSFLVQPNVPSEVWFYPWDDIDLAHYFDAEESRWRTGSRPAIVHLRLLVMPLDWVSVQPDMIEVQSVDAVRMSMSR
jgi:hypothetical protein